MNLRQFRKLTKIKSTWTPLLEDLWQKPKKCTRKQALWIKGQREKIAKFIDNDHKGLLRANETISNRYE